MIIVNITINIAPEWLDHQLAQERMFKQLQAIKARDDQEFQDKVDALQAITHKITCSKCGWTGTGYLTPGRAKMALSGHRRSCSRKD